MGRNEAQNQIIKEKRREEILKVALRLFATKGLAATKITDIISAAKISQGLLYHYFTSKEEIFTTLVREAFEKMGEACRMLEAMPVPPREKVCVALEKLIEGFVQSEHAGMYYLFLSQAAASEAIPQEAKVILRKKDRLHYETMTRIFAEGQKEGVFYPDPPETLAQVFWTTINGLAIHKAVRGKAFSAPPPSMLLRMFLPIENGMDAKRTSTSRGKKRSARA